MANRLRKRFSKSPYTMNPGVADAPEEPESKGFPGPIAPLIRPWCSHLVEESNGKVGFTGGGINGVVVVAQFLEGVVSSLVDQSTSGIGRCLGAEPFQYIGSSDEPPQFVVGSKSQWMLKHCEPQVKPSSHETNQEVGILAEILYQDRCQIVVSDSALSDFTPVVVFRQVGMTTIRRRSQLQGFVERQVFKRMERIVMDKDRDWPLSR